MLPIPTTTGDQDAPTPNPAERLTIAANLTESFNHGPPGAASVAAPQGVEAAPPLRKSRYKVPQRPRPWTAEEDGLLRSLWAIDWSGSEIAEHFTGRSRCSILARAKRLGLTAPDRAPMVRNVAKPKWRAPEPCGCRWIEGHPGSGEWRWCDRTPLPGRPYCAPHERRAWRKPSEEARDFEPAKMTRSALIGGISKAYIGEV